MSDQRHPIGKRHMRRVGDMLGELAAGMGIEKELRQARQTSAWERLVEELLPGARGASQLLSVQPPALVVSASDNHVAQELRLRQSELLTAFAQLPEGVHLLELRVVVRPTGRVGEPR